MRLKTANALLSKVQYDYSLIVAEFSQTRRHAWREFNCFEPYLDSSARILDVGCGNGRLLSTFLQDKGFASYVGVDASENVVAEARRLWMKRGNPHLDVRFLPASVIDLFLPSRSFDHVFCIAMLHHIPRPLQMGALFEMRHVMADSGRLFITVWNLHQKRYRRYFFEAFGRACLTLGEFSRRDLFIPWGGEHGSIKRYYYAFTVDSLRLLLREAGFLIENECVSDHNICFICKKNEQD